MSILSASTRRRSNRQLAIPRLSEILAIALAAAVVAYALHHLPPLSDHLAASVAVVLLTAAAAAVAVGAVSAERRAPTLPTVLVPPPGGIEARPLRAEDLEFCTALHAEALEHGFFVGLGPRFLRSYYAAFLDSPHALAFAAIVGDQPVGFLVGAVDARSHARWLVRHRGVALGLRAAGGMALHPAAAVRFLRTRLRRYAGAWHRHRRSDAPSRAPVAGGTAVLSHVVVLPGARTLGAGGSLVRAFEAEARRRGAERAFLSTLEGADGAGSFYATLGWRRSSQLRTPDGRRMEEWARDLRGGDA